MSAANPPQPAASDSVRMIRLMGGVSLICGLLIVATHVGTLEPIRRNQEFITKETVSTLLPGVDRQVVYSVVAGDLQPGAQPNVPVIYAGFNKDGALIGVVIETSERGYADTIRAMYAYSPDLQAITGFQVMELKETPGLGDKIAKDPSFLDNFKKLDVTAGPDGKPAHPVVTVKHGTKKNAWEVDAISGATISSRAVGRMLAKSTDAMLPLLRKNLDRIRKGN